MSNRAKLIGVVALMSVLALVGYLWNRGNDDAKPPAPVVVTGSGSSAATPTTKPVPVAPAPALPVPPPSAPEAPVMSGLGSPGVLAKIPERYELTLTSSGHRAVSLAGGTADVYGWVALERGKRVVRGAVRDRSGTGVAGAQVLVDEHGFHLFASSIMATTGATTGADGTFAITDAPATGFVIALDAKLGWSAVAPLTDAPTLTLVGRGALHGRLLYDGHGESFTIQLEGDNLSIIYQSDRDGTFTIASLLPGKYRLKVGLAQVIGGGSSRTSERDVVIVDGQTTEVAIGQKAETTVVLLAKPIGESIMEYWLTKGDAVPPDYATLRAKGHAQYLLGGQDKATAAEFHDVSPGAYVACAAGDNGKTFACRQVTVLEGEPVREIDLAVVTTATRD